MEPMGVHSYSAGFYSVPEDDYARLVAATGRLDIHSAFCGDCGGWEGVRNTVLGPHEVRLDCESCDEVIALVRTVEARS